MTHDDPFSHDKTKPSEYLKWALIVASVALFLGSLTQPCFYTEGREDRDDSLGIMCLIIGVGGVVDGVPAWLANPAMALSWLFTSMRSSRSNQVPAVVFGVLSVVFSLSFLLNQQIMINEAGAHGRIGGYRIGYWLWLGSTALAMFASLSGLYFARGRHKLR